jgi:hypothetical protein
MIRRGELTDEAWAWVEPLRVIQRHHCSKLRVLQASPKRTILVLDRGYAGELPRIPLPGTWVNRVSSR